MIQLFDFYPSPTLPLIPILVHIIISSYLCFRGNFLTLAWYHQLGSVAQIRGDCEKRSLSHLNILFWQFSSPSTQHPRDDEKWSSPKSSSCAHTRYAWVFYSREIWYEISISKYKLHCSVGRIYIWVRWCRGQPIRGQYCGHVTRIDQSEASEYAWADGRVMTRMLSDCLEKFPMKWEPENSDPICLESVTGLPWSSDGKQIAVTKEN